MSSRKIAISGLIAAAYVVLTIFVKLPFDVRASELLVPLVYFNPMFTWGLTLGCFLANLLGSPIPVPDMIIGTFGTYFTCIFITWVKSMPIKNEIVKYYLSSLGATISMVFIAGELWYFLNLPFMETLITISIIEFVVVTIIGYSLFLPILKSENLKNRLGNLQ